MSQPCEVGDGALVGARSCTDAVLLALVLFALPTASWARGTTSYSYDAQGRLTSLVRSGVSTNPSMTYKYDAADNPSTLSVKWAHRRVIALPLGGGAIIALPN